MIVCPTLASCGGSNLYAHISDHISDHNIEEIEIVSVGRCVCNIISRIYMPVEGAPENKHDVKHTLLCKRCIYVAYFHQNVYFL